MGIGGRPVPQTRSFVGSSLLPFVSAVSLCPLSGLGCTPRSPVSSSVGGPYPKTLHHCCSSRGSGGRMGSGRPPSCCSAARGL